MPASTRLVGIFVWGVCVCGLALGCGGGGSGTEPAGNGAPSGQAPPLDPPAGPAVGFGALTGDCRVLDAMVLDSLRPAIFRNALDFGTDPFDASDYARLSAGGQRLYDANPDDLAEVFAYETLHRCEGAALSKTGDQILYRSPTGKEADFLVTIDGRRVGVTVTRAFEYPPGTPYAPHAAKALLTEELEDVQRSRANVDVEDAWAKPILCILAYADQEAEVLRAEYATLSTELQANTIVLITATHGDDGFLYGFGSAAPR